MTPGPLVVFGYGNPSRGDDALGPVLMARLEAWAENQPGRAPTLVEDFQLQIEHAEDLRGVTLALFVDADASCPPPFRFQRIRPAQDDSFTTHELSPASVLHVFRQVGGSEPPPAFVLSVRGEAFDLGESLTPRAQAHAEAAWTFLQELLADPRPETWAARVT